MYFIDLHMHSKHSPDSIMNVNTMIKIAHKAGLNGIAITDHNTIAGGLDGVALNRYKDFDVVCGCEMDSEEGHILGLFLNEEIRTNNVFEIVDEIRDQGGISVLAHPFKHDRIINKDLLNKIDCIEGFNSRLSLKKNLKAQQLVKESCHPQVVGSDAHFYFEIGNSMLMVDESVSDLEDLKKAILRNKTSFHGTVTPFPSGVFSKFVFKMRMCVSDRITTNLFNAFR